MSEEYQTVDEIKELGNQAVKNEKFEEAILHYTHAIKRDPTNFALYSNRSFAFLKMQQYFYALQDANETIRLNATWAKGYFRKGEVEYATYHFNDAINSYEKALQFMPDDKNILDSILKAKKEECKDRKANEQIPWLGAGIGIVLGVIILITDYIYTVNPTHPLLMAIITMSIAMMGYGIAKGCRYYVNCQRDSLIQPPPNLIDLDGSSEGEEKVEGSTKQTNNRYTKSQARQRYKKGKM